VRTAELVIGSLCLAATLHASRSRELRFYNTSDDEQVVRLGGETWRIPPHAVVDASTDSDLLAIESPREVTATIRVIEDASGMFERQTRITSGAQPAACPTINVRVPARACRFGTAEAMIEPIDGATYTWSVEGGVILAGQGTTRVRMSLGAATAAIVRVQVTAPGCAAEGSAVLALREPLRATLQTPSTANAGTPIELRWSYNTAEPILTQQLRLPGSSQAIALSPDTRSYVYTPATEGSQHIELSAATYRVGGRRRAVRSGDGPGASSCAETTVSADVTVGPPCANPTATVSGGGTACGEVAIEATFTGTPPFSGRWSDGATFTTAGAHLTRTVTASGIYTLERFEDARCAGTVAGSAAVTVLETTRITDLAVSPAAVAIFSDNGRVGLGFANVHACSIRSALGNFFAPYACTGTGAISVGYVPENDVGQETITVRVSGPCGTDERAQPWFVCGQSGELSASGPTTFCTGGSVTLTASPVGVSAGPPYQEYRFYRCPHANSQCHDFDWTLVQAGSSNTYLATTSSNYGAAVVDRLGCPGIIGNVTRVTVTTCP